MRDTKYVNKKEPVITTDSSCNKILLQPHLNLAAISKMKHQMNGTKVSDLISISGDVHHIFPRAYLKKNGVDSKVKYNQIANYIYLDTQVNKAISDDAPCVYFSKIQQQCENGDIQFGNIGNAELLAKNLEENCIPANIANMDVNNYDEFLTERRKLMAKLIERYYKNL